MPYDRDLLVSGTRGWKGECTAKGCRAPAEYIEYRFRVNLGWAKHACCRVHVTDYDFRRQHSTAIQVDIRARIQAMREEEAKDRRAEILELNDRIWGPGNWVACERCTRQVHGDEPVGIPVYHHVDAHT